MKIISLRSPSLIVLSALLFMSCVGDDKFDSPNTTIQEPKIEESIVTIDAVIGNYNQAGETVTFQNTNTAMVGYVISNDEGGNFFKELIVQDKPENPTTGIAIQINRTPLYTQYEFGRKVYVKLDGLSVGNLNGVIQLGKLEGNDIVRLPASDINDHIIKSAEVATIVPRPITICGVSSVLENLFVRLTNVQFNKKEVLGTNPKTFAAENDDQFSGDRIVESCEQDGAGGSIILSTSTFSDFKSILLPRNKGTINGILTRDFFDSFYTIEINSPEDLNFTDNERCDVQELDCGTLDAPGDINLFSDDFQSQTNNELITGNGWINYIQLGSNGWEAYTSNGGNASQGRSARMTSKNSGDDCSVAWLIAPSIDLIANNNVSVSFETSNSFADGSNLEVLFSTNWDGEIENILNANWGILPAAYIVKDSDLFSQWFSSGVIDLSCGEGLIHIAFRYRGNGQPDLDGTYELDNISVDKLL